MVELRAYQHEYIDEFVKYRDNPNIAINGFDRTPIPYTIEFAMQLFNVHVGKSPAERFLIFYNNRFCGEIGIWLNEDVLRLNAEIGYFIAEPYWGKGIATEAIRQMVDYTFSHFNIIRIIGNVFEHNKASMRALEKNNFILEAIQKKGIIKNNLIMDSYVWVKIKEGI
jgi:RimJ/RimL family protein N-acetyltransferase